MRNPIHDAIRGLESLDSPEVVGLRRKLRRCQDRADKCRERIAMLYQRGDASTAEKARAELVRICCMETAIVDEIMRVKADLQKWKLSDRPV